MPEIERYPHRVLVRWQEGRKVQFIQEVNRFLLYSTKGRSAKMYQQRNHELTALEVSFEDKGDALMFKLSFNP